MLRHTTILSIPITQGSKNNILEEIGKIIVSASGGAYIVTPNPEIIVEARKNKLFKTALENAKLSLADGVGVVLAAKMLGIEAITRMPGADLVDILCNEAGMTESQWLKKPVRIGFLGGRGGVAEKTAECLVKKYPELTVVFVDEEWGDEGFQKARRFRTLQNKFPTRDANGGEGTGEKNADPQDTKESPNHKRQQIDILFVALGSPKQEIWMYENRERIPARLMIGVGGAFDMISGKVPRAPKLVREFGFEWLYRLIRQPWRLKRQLSLPVFLFLVLKEKFITS